MDGWVGDAVEGAVAPTFARQKQLFETNYISRAALEHAAESALRSARAQANAPVVQAGMCALGMP